MKTEPYIANQDYSDTEWNTRVNLAACYRIFDYLGWSESIYNHISLRVPGPELGFLLNPFGLHYSEVTASNLIKVGADGSIKSTTAWPINPAGITFHGAIHQHVKGAHCVMHVHTTATLAVCCLEDGLRFDNFYSAQLFGRVAYHDFEGITVRADEGERILASAAGKQVLMLRHHGPVIIAKSLAEGFSLMFLLNRACEVQLASHSMGRVKQIPQNVIEQCAKDSLEFDRRFRNSKDSFNAMVRLVEKKDPSFRY